VVTGAGPEQMILSGEGRDRGEPLAGAVDAVDQIVAQFASRANPDFGLIERPQIIEMLVNGGRLLAGVGENGNVETQLASGSRASKKRQVDWTPAPRLRTWNSRMSYVAGSITIPSGTSFRCRRAGSYEGDSGCSIHVTPVDQSALPRPLAGKRRPPTPGCR
jgi:hypothetical protein